MLSAAELLDAGPCAIAVAEAKRRWGLSGSVSLADEWRHACYLVGELAGANFVVRGRGSSWNAAFDDADARLIDASRRHSTR